MQPVRTSSADKKTSPTYAESSLVTLVWLVTVLDLGVNCQSRYLGIRVPIALPAQSPAEYR